LSYKRNSWIPARGNKNNFCPQNNALRAETILGKVVKMRKEYDFSKAKKEPYAGQLKKQGFRIRP
jgi:hypothetical protein